MGGIPEHAPHLGSCWIWTGPFTVQGYGQIDMGKRQKAHRVSWKLHFGDIPEGDGFHGTCVCHKCDNPACVNPDHLFLGTHADNMRDKVDKGLAGPMRGSDNSQARLTESDVVAIRAERGKTRGAIVAERFGVSISTIYGIWRGRLWKCVE